MIDVGVGTLPGWLTLAALIAAAWTFHRGGGGEALRALRDTNEVLAETVETQREKLQEAEKQIAQLQGKTDVSIALVTALSPINEWTAGHETRAQDRHEKTMIVLELIASRLGPDKENGT